MNQIICDLDEKSNKEKAIGFSRFFKTAEGEYGQGDKFIGVSVPNNRKVAKKYKNASLNQIKELLESQIHEHRLCALLIMVDQYQKGSDEKRQKIFEFYIKMLQRINNWDLVDSSADKIIGAHLLEKSQNEKKLIYDFAKSKNMWERRIAIISTFYFIKKGKFEDTIRISEILLKDNEDLIHKAVGWMLREMGKKGGDKELLEFLDKYSKMMPRTMLRYSIERMDQQTRKKYMER